MAQAEIWTERLFLRAAEDRDLPYFQKWFSDPVAMKYWSTPPHSTREETKKYLDYMVASPTNGVMEFAICLTSSPSRRRRRRQQQRRRRRRERRGVHRHRQGRIMGRQRAGVHHDREYWGKGYAFEALDAVLRHFWALEDTAPEAVVADLGFKEVGSAKRTYETHLGWRDSVFLEARRPAEVEMEDGEIEDA
ncbi:acyl-CoA N-acyltransferase [Pholiota molesta]|nr:acyl-CoA N-acyltransferase [Pholiota molesta]